MPAHDSGSMWVATPSPWWTSHHLLLARSPGALEQKNGNRESEERRGSCSAHSLTTKAPYKSRRHRSPVDVVVISSSVEGDRTAESLEVKTPVDRPRSDPYWGASNLAGCSKCEPEKPRNWSPTRNGLWEHWECRASATVAKAVSTSMNWTRRCPDSPGSQRTACQDRMDSESPEPLADRQGAPVQRRHHV